MKHYLSVTLIAGVILFQTGAINAQSAAVSHVKESQKPDLALYFYPSTLRMVNLSNNEDFDLLIKHIRKIRFFQWSKENYEKIDEKSLVKALLEEKFEECMSISGMAMDLMVFGRDQQRKDPELVAIVEVNNQVQLLDIQGMVNVAKIPQLISTLNADDFINVLDLNNKKKKK